MARKIVRGAGAALALWGGLGFAAVAQAQSEVDEAHATVNRLLNGAGDLNIFTSGKVLEGVYTPLHTVRTESRCRTQVVGTRPNHPDIPETYRNKASEGALEWEKVSNVQATGTRVYYDSFRPNGQRFTYHFQLGSSDAANRAAAAFRTLASACSSPAEEEIAAETVVHDERGNTASLAIDRRDGSRYGWAIDYKTSGEADRRALGECQRSGAKCQIVLRFTGGCGAYAADQAKGSTAWGWGTHLRRGDAEARAHSEARRRGGTNVFTRVWGCNSVKSAGGTQEAPPEPPPVEQDPAEQARIAELNRRANERDREARERLERSKQAQAEYERRMREVAAAGDEYARAKAAHEAELAKARAAAEEYRRQKEAYEKELASGKYKKP